MKNKVLVKLWIPELDVNYDVFIPVNEVMWKVKVLLLKSIEDMLKLSIDYNKEYYLINKDNCKIYDNNEIVINTDIRNGTEIILVSYKK